jgi:hypothetical protein
MGIHWSAITASSSTKAKILQPPKRIEVGTVVTECLITQNMDFYQQGIEKLIP